MPEAKGEGESEGRKTVSQRSGAPGDVRSPADGRKQAGFTPAVSAADVVQAEGPYSVSGADGSVRYSGGENVIIPPAPPWSFQLLVEDGGNAAAGL